MRLGIFGGTFNPIHFGHLRAAEEVWYSCNVDRILFLPSGNPPLKVADLADAHHRFVMAERAIESNEHFSISNIEILKKGKSYTVNVLKELYAMYPEDELFFVLGIDAFLDIPHWWHPEALASMIDFIVVTRPGYRITDIVQSPYVKDTLVIPEPLCGENYCIGLKSGRKATLVPLTPLDISSTKIRRLVRAGKSIKYLLPEAVEHYIITESIYGNEKTGDSEYEEQT